MNLSSRVKALEVQAQPLAQLTRKREVDQWHEQGGRFGMMNLMAYGLTASEARSEIAAAYAGKGYGPRASFLACPHYFPEKTSAHFQAFLDSDSEAAQLFEQMQ